MKSCVSLNRILSIVGWLFCIHILSVVSEPLKTSKKHAVHEKINCDVLDAVELLKSNDLLDILCHPYETDSSATTSSNSRNASEVIFSPLVLKANLDFHQRANNVLFEDEEESEEKKTESEIVINVCCILICITASSMAAAFTIGVITIDPFNLAVQVRTAKTEKERIRAAALIPIVEKRHQLMVTLLIINAVANEALPIFVEELVPGYIAIGLSVLSVLIFADILPTALFSGPHKIKLSSFFVPLMKFLMFILTPIALPISSFLDWIVGHQDPSYDRNQFAALVRVNYEERESRRLIEYEGTTDCMTDDDEKKEILLKNTSSLSHIGVDEVLMMEGCLSLRSKNVHDLMKPINDVFVLSDDVVLNKERILKIYLSGHSRIPVFTRNRLQDSNAFGILGKSDITHIRGVLLTKQLMLVESQDKKVLSSIPLQQPICVPPEMNLANLLQEFQRKTISFKGGHLAIVCRNPMLASNAMNQSTPIPSDAGVMGIVTLEDVMEALLQIEISDESDREHHAIAHSNLFSLISSSTSCLPY